MPIVPEVIIRRHLTAIVCAAMPLAMRTAGRLLAFMIPLSLAVTLLDYTGVLPSIASRLHPVMRVVGLPGEAALVVLTAAGLNIYSAIAVMQTMTLTVREGAILALICLIAHNLPVESAVQHQAGASGVRMALLRLLAALVGGMMLNAFMPVDGKMMATVAAAPTVSVGLSKTLIVWAKGMAWVALKIILILAGLMVLQRWLAEVGWLHRLARRLGPVLAPLGLPRSTAFLWLVANCMGLAYGAAVMIEHARAGDISRADLRLFNCHVAISHSLLEDTLLFVALGIPAAWIVWPRLFLAAVVVWLYRAWMRYRPA